MIKKQRKRKMIKKNRMKQKQQTKIKKSLQTNYLIDLKNLIIKKYIFKK